MAGYECDKCGKIFFDTKGAFIGPSRPPMYDRMVYCDKCYKGYLEKAYKYIERGLKDVAETN